MCVWVVCVRWSGHRGVHTLAAVVDTVEEGNASSLYMVFLVLVLVWSGIR